MAAPAIHHLNCGTMCPWGERLINGEGSLLRSGRIVAHCLLIEGADGLTLIDTGYGTDDVRNPRQLGQPFRFLVRPQLNESETALAQVRALGFDPSDVRHIVVTHLDVDHAGGLPDFPDAEVHILAAEHEAAMNPKLTERTRYVKTHWKHGPKWATHAVEGDQWLGFESVRVLPGDAEVLMIPLPGHTRGHTGIAVRRNDDWLLHCGDAFFYYGEVETPRRCTPTLRAFQNIVGANRKLRMQNQERLRELAREHPDEVELICAHDPFQLERAQAAAPQPAPA